MKIKQEVPQYIAEFIGTFFLVFFGCGAVILSELDPSYNSSFIPIIFGGTVSIMIYAVGHISGAHFNPAVTLAFWCINKFPGRKVIGYILAQVLGALVASLIHVILWGGKHSFGATGLSTSLSSGIVTELILSFVLMFVIVSVATDSRAVGELAGMAIGSTVALCAFVGGPLTGASMNPARSLAPALLSNQYSSLWLYLVVPIVGTILGAQIYQWIQCYRDEASDQSGCC